MADMLEFDEEATRRTEEMYSRAAVEAQRTNVLAALALEPGESVLDIGSGPGFLARAMATAVGNEGRICGIDVSEPMIAMARTRCADLPWVEFQKHDAVQLPYPDESFDVAVSTQVYEYVPDIAAALADLWRVLRPGGRALILDTDWGSVVWHSHDPARMRRVLMAWDEHLAHPHLPRRLRPLLRAAGFRLADQYVFPILEPEFRDDTYSQGIAGFIEAYVRGRKGITVADARAWMEELGELDAVGEYFFSMNRYVFIAVKDGTARV